jgi:hypothetical protein
MAFQPREHPLARRVEIGLRVSASIFGQSSFTSKPSAATGLTSVLTVAGIGHIRY